MSDLAALNRQVAGTIERGLGARDLLEKQLAEAGARQSNALEEMKLLENVVALLAALQETWKERFQAAIGQIVSEGLAGVFGEKLELVCLHRDASVLMADGAHQQIQKLVRQRSTGPVMSLQDGQMVSKKIVGWHESKIGDRRWVGLHLTTNPWATGGKKRCLWVTDDHPILSPLGWRSAGELVTGDQVVTNDPMPSREQWEVITGSLLGDAHLSQRSPRSKVQFWMDHSVKQREWLQTKMRGLAGLGAKKSKVSHRGESERWYTLSTAALTGPYRDWYVDRRKRIDRVAVERFFSDRLLATWLLDDGRYDRAQRVLRVATCSFDYDDHLWLSAFLRRQGFENSITRDRSYWGLRFRQEASSRIILAIGPYVPPSMRYKLGAHLTSPYDPQLWHLPQPTRFIDEVEIDSREEPLPIGLKTVYCLDVEGTHNFFASGLNVHNCEIGQSGDRPTARFAVRDSRGLETEIMDARGGGLVNVVSFLLRVLVLLSARPAMRRLLVLDETFGNVSAEYVEPLIALLRRICDDGDFQLVLVSHRQELAEAADVAYRFELVDGVTRIEKIRSREDAIAEGGTEDV